MICYRKDLLLFSTPTLKINLSIICRFTFKIFDDAPTLISLGVHDYYPYVFFKMSMDFIERR